MWALHTLPELSHNYRVGLPGKQVFVPSVQTSPSWTQPSLALHNLPFLPGLGLPVPSHQYPQSQTQTGVLGTRQCHRAELDMGSRGQGFPSASPPAVTESAGAGEPLRHCVLTLSRRHRTCPLGGKGSLNGLTVDNQPQVCFLLYLPGRAAVPMPMNAKSPLGPALPVPTPA